VCHERLPRDGERSCGEDEGRPLEAAFQREASNRPLLLRPKGVVVSEWVKGASRSRQVSIKEMSGSEPLRTCRKTG
jgi:hypothetical protein